MSNEKMVYIPRNWEISYNDINGNEVISELCINREYKITSSEGVLNLTVAGIREEQDKKYVIAKVVMNPGTMNVMKKVEDIKIDVSTISEIVPLNSKYVRVLKSNRDKDNIDTDTFTFAFDTEKFSSKYKISVNAGEFVSLAVKDINEPNRKSRSYYGHVIDVNSDKGTIKFSRYISNKGVRDVYTQTIPLSALLGVYRYELTLEEVALEVANSGNEEDSSKEAVTVEE